MGSEKRVPRVRARGGLVLSLLVAAGITAGTTTANDTRPEHPTIGATVLGDKFTATPTIIEAANVKNTAPGGNGNGNNGNGLGNGGGAKLYFTLSGTVSGLVLGQLATLPVSVTNPSTNNGTLTINTISVVPGDAVDSLGKVVCASTNLWTDAYDASTSGATAYVLPSGGNTVVNIGVRLVDSTTVNQTSCRGKTLPLTINGTATVTR